MAYFGGMPYGGFGMPGGGYGMPAGVRFPSPPGRRHAASCNLNPASGQQAKGSAMLGRGSIASLRRCPRVQSRLVSLSPAPSDV